MYCTLTQVILLLWPAFLQGSIFGFLVLQFVFKKKKASGLFYFSKNYKNAKQFSLSDRKQHWLFDNHNISAFGQLLVTCLE